MSDSGNRFFTEFLSDYFAECEEHLARVRRDLLALENLVNQDRMDVTLGNNLLRSFHTIKGLSGMVGQKEAQELAHEMESYLRALLRDQGRHSAAGQDALVHGVRALEQVLAAARAGQAAPEITAIVKELAQLPGVTPLPDAAAAQEAEMAAEPAPLPPQETSTPEPPLPPGARIWRFEFAPDPALVQRGINVNVIRARLEEIGELRHSRPLVQGEGKIAFEFLVATTLEESAFSGWRQDGVTYSLQRPVEPQVPGVGVDRPLTPEGVTLPLTFGQSSVVRVDLAKLDDLMQMVGELVISRASLENHVKNLEDRVPAAQWRSLQENSLAMERQLRTLREGVMRVRMVPIGEVFQRLQFGAYDLGRDQQKKFIMEMKGQDTEIDKFVVDKMMDPLLHLVRNMVSHGLESEPERVARGKPAQGKILLQAAMSGDLVVLEIADDGKGVAPDLVFARARALGLIDTDTLPDPDSVLDILCEPGFSIKDRADLASGRGVGMTVVKNAVQELGGTLAMETQVGVGTRFTIQLPLTLAIVDALIIKVAEQTFAVPMAAVREVIELNPAALTVLDDHEILNYREGVLPLIRLSRFFGLSPNGKASAYALVVGSHLSLVGLVIDRILGQRAIVVHPLSDPLVQSPAFAGATELGDGRGILILNVTGLINDYRRSCKTISQTEGV